MSRTPNGELRDRILDVALTLLRLHGEDGVTLRAVAKAAGTTTPTVYNRFRDKGELLVALALRQRDRYVERQSGAKSLEAAAAIYLDWASRNPHEYGLIYGLSWFQVFSPETGRPGLRWAQEQFAARYGGYPQEYEEVVTSLWLLLHGAASLLSQNPTHPLAKYVREQCLLSCNRIISSGKFLSKRNQNFAKNV